MPPKSKPAAPSKKTEQKKKEKVIEDKTFGLKNKKGAKQQKFIQQVEKQVKSGGIHPLKADEKKLEKEKKLKEQKELAALFKPVQTQKVEKGADPKSVVCAFFKQGQCTKGDKCKFSHDLTIERKAEKRSLYVDMRDDEEETMENWDEAKLKEVIEKKHGEKGKMPTTDIICKHFLEAVEKSKYGWFWTCPTGENCIYRHALPPGFVLKKDKKKLEDKSNEITLEDLIEKERAALGSKQTKVTLESFLAWKKRKIQEKKDQLQKDEDKKRNEFKAGRQVGLSGREMFSFNPELAKDNDMEDGDELFDSSAYPNEEENIVYKEIDLGILGGEGQEADGTGTVATEDRFKDTSASEKAIEGAAAVPINENLFLEADLDELDEELEGLDLEE
ncbi:zinc finger CCCH domain-containing protein 15 homolog [Diorhabda carinulata]|uniref:zinc finger CCCH domain-containing protein 15 homolog n=1 Tax=Diorhabda sublineata TaxID=1163346 RepID=UPI0024E16577|nr:zinc finger CCCH domain-containing protein 15 homolog [Diorhabda sublineata]XP_057652611.1 zinc finger CCCH domain-containing protein 15 homolog [Diorhabda carinulata]